MDVIILAGGKGTRLRSVISHVPKPMAPINGLPFLDNIFTQLAKANITQVILSICYMSDIIITYFGYRYRGIDIEYSIETEPLGTGGAIKQALNYTCEKNVLVMNGDTYFSIDLSEFMVFHETNNKLMTIALKPMLNFSRYGSVKVASSGDVVSFQEKQRCIKGNINAGVYMLSRNIFSDVQESSFSIEQFMQSSPSILASYISDNYFVDIGVPDDYALACRELAI